MIAAWMIYAVVVGVLIAGAAVAGDQLALRNGRESRRVWMLALAGALVLPVAGVLLKDAPPATEVDGALAAVSPAAGVVMHSVDRLATVDGWLLIAWGLASAGVAVFLLMSLASHHLRFRRLRATVVDGVPVLLTDDIGPAVTGVVRSRILLPRWVLGVSSAQRQMILRHEQEHMRAGDPRLLAFAAATLVAMPWNPAAWYLARRLRLAIEIDCDRRVMRAGGLDTRSYAELLIAVGARRSAPAHAVGFSLGRPFLEQRIDRMTSRRSGAGWATNLLMSVGVFGVLCAAWALPQPVRAIEVTLDIEASCPMTDSAETTRGLLHALGRET